MVRPQRGPQQAVNSASHFHPLYLRVGLQEEVSSARVCLNNYILSEKLLRSIPFSQDKSGQLQGNPHSPSYRHNIEAGKKDVRQRASKHPSSACSTSLGVVSIAHPFPHLLPTRPRFAFQIPFPPPNCRSFKFRGKQSQEQSR